MYIPEINQRSKKIIGISSLVAAVALVVALASYTNVLHKLTDIFGSKAAAAPIVLNTKNDFLGASLTPEALNFYKTESTTVDDEVQSYLQPESGDGQDGYITVDASLFGNFSGGDGANNDPNATEGLGNLLGKKHILPIEQGPVTSQMPVMRYFSPALTLEGSKNSLTEFSAVDYSANDLFRIGYAYRQADNLVDLEAAEFLSIDLGDGTKLSESELVSKELSMGIEVGKYLQLKVEFTRNGTEAPAFAPAVYRMQLSSESLDVVTPPNGGPVDVDTTINSRQVTINYAAVNAPKSAEIKIYSADSSGTVIGIRNNEDLSTRLAMTINNLALEDNKQYMLAVKSPSVLEKLVQFTVVKDVNIYQFNLGNFTLLPAGTSDSTITEKRVVDVNGDGKINFADLALFMQLYGQEAEGGLPTGN